MICYEIVLDVVDDLVGKFKRYQQSTSWDTRLLKKKKKILIPIFRG